MEGLPAGAVDARGAARASQVRAMLWMLLGAACVVAMSAILKRATRELPVGVVFLFRMAFAIPLVLPWIARYGLVVLATRRLKAHFLRGAVGALAMWCWVFGVKYLPLTTFTAISFTRPLWTPLTAAVFLGERVGWRRGLATVVGFTGVVIVVRPALDAQAAVLVAILGGAVSSLTLVQVKQLATTEPAGRIVFYFSVFGALWALPLALWDWVTPNALQLAWLALAAFVAASAQYCVARAAALGDATVITPVDFMQLPLAAVVGVAMFGETPDILTAVGIAGDRAVGACDRVRPPRTHVIARVAADVVTVTAHTCRRIPPPAEDLPWRHCRAEGQATRMTQIIWHCRATRGPDGGPCGRPRPPAPGVPASGRGSRASAPVPSRDP